MRANPGSGASGRTSGMWYILPVALLVLTAIGVIVLFPGGEILAPVLDTRTITLPGEAPVVLKRAGPYFIYRDQNISWDVPLEFTVTREDAPEPLPLSPIGMSTTFTTGNRSYLAVKRFEVEAAGTVMVKGVYAGGVEGKPQTVLVAPALEFEGIFGGVMRIIACVFAGILGLALAGVSFVLIVLKRGRRRLLPTPPGSGASG